MAIRSLSDIINSAITYLQSKRPDIAVFTGTVTRDVVIESPAQEFENVYNELATTQELQSIEFASSLSLAQLSALGANYGLTPLPGTSSTGSITFQIRNYTTTSSNISVPTGTVVSTQSSTNVPQISFTTTTAVTFLAAQAPSYFNPASGFYEQTASISAVSIGSNGNVAAGTIVNLITPIAGITGVINYIPTTGGTDVESTTAFGQRIQLKLSGNNVGTPNGIVSLVNTNPSVLQSIVVTPNDPEMLRSQFGGEVDVYIVGEILTSTTDTILYETAGVQTVVLLNQPTHSISSVTGIVSAAPHTFIQGTDYVFVPDPDILVAGSTRAQNAIQFLGAGTLPDNNTNVSVNYVYDSLIATSQALVDQNSNHIVTSDVLVREAAQAIIGVQADINIFPGYSGPTVVAAVQTSLGNYISSLRLGNSIPVSEIITVIENTAGVEQVNTSTLVLTKDFIVVPISPTSQSIPILKTEYPVSGTFTINVVS